MRLDKLLAPSLALCTSCGAGGSISGVFTIFDPGPEQFYEHEPNNSVDSPDYITSLCAGDSIEISGYVDDGCCDPFDGFEIHTEEALWLNMELTAHDGWSDLDFCIYDPQADVFLECFETADHPETGSICILLPAELQIVVRAWSGASNYSLSIEACDISSWFYPSTAAFTPSAGWSNYRQSAEQAGEFEVIVRGRDAAEPTREFVVKTNERVTRILR